eukprot:gi/632937987/ref/XP_007901839.1/ PREDICTED: probable G-protein coupled receptor 61 [Callorhinchus milii]
MSKAAKHVKVAEKEGKGSKYFFIQKVEGVGRSIGLFLMLLINVLGLVGNLAVLVVIVKTPELRKFLFVLHLCLVDLLSATTLMPLGIVLSSALFAQVAVSEALCQAYVFLEICFSSASILTITAINIERYYYIVHPLRYEVKMTVGLAVSVLVIVWVSAVPTSSIPLIGWNPRVNASSFSSSSSSSPHASSRTRCSVQRDSGDYGKALVLVFGLSCFILPTLVIFAVYGSVFKVARIIALQRGPLPASWVAASPRHRSDSTASQVTMVTGGASRRRHSPDVGFGGGKAAITLLTVGGQFLVCWMPYFAYHLRTVLTVTELPPEPWETVVTWLAFFSFAANPFFYGYLNRQIRSELTRLLKCFLKQSLDNQLGPLSREGSMDENFLQFLQRTSHPADRRAGCLPTSPRTLLNQSTMSFRIPGQIVEEIPEMMEQETGEDLAKVHTLLRQET